MEDLHDDDDFIPGAPRLLLLAIDGDLAVHQSIDIICDQCHYLVEASIDDEESLNLLLEIKVCPLDGVLIDFHMATRNDCHFLKQVKSNLNLPIVVMYDITVSDADKNAIEDFVFYYLKKPLSVEDFNNMLHKIEEKVYNKDNSEVACTVTRVNTTTNAPKEVVDVVEPELEPEPEPAVKSPRLEWTPRLQEQFMEALIQIGIENATPKDILNLMDVPRLTTKQISLQLEDYRSKLKVQQGNEIEGSSSAVIVADYETPAPSDIDEHPLIRKLREHTFSPLVKVSNTAPSCDDDSGLEPNYLPFDIKDLCISSSSAGNNSDTLDRDDIWSPIRSPINLPEKDQSESQENDQSESHEKDHYDSKE